MGLFTNKRGRSLRFISLIAAVSMTYSSSAQGFNSIFSAVSKTVIGQVGGGSSHYTDTPYVPNTLPNPVVQPDNRGNFYLPADIAAIEMAAQIEMGGQTQPPIPNLSNPAPVDPGNNSALYGRPALADLSQGDPNAVAGGALIPPFTGGSTAGTGTTATSSTTATSATTATTSTTSTTSTTGTTGTTSTTSTTGTSGTTGIIGVGGNGAHAGDSFPWEGSRPGGGSEYASAVVNTQTGNRLTTVPIVGWKVKGGVPFGLTLFHNSQDSLDTGWGKGWRSNIDFSIIYNGRLSLNVSTAVVVYPNGRRLTFKYQHDPNSTNPEFSSAFFPPTGFYDIMYPIGPNGGIPVGWTLRTKSQMIYTFNNLGKLTSYRDRYGNNVTITRIFPETKIISPTGEFISITDSPYTQFGSGSLLGSMKSRYYTHVSVPGSRVWDFNYARRPDTDMTMTTVTYPTLTTTRPTQTFTYAPPSGTINTCAPIANETDPIGRVWRQTYENFTSLKTFQLPVAGNQTTDPKYTLTYYSDRTEFSQPSGKKTIDRYNSGVLAQVEDQAHYTTSYTYDQYYNVKILRDARGNRSYADYDAFANVLATQDQRQFDNFVKAYFTYNQTNDILTQKDTRGAITEYVRNPATGTVTSVKDGKNNLLNLNTYNGDGSIASTASQGVTTTINYDAKFLPNNVVTPDGSATITYGTTDHRIGKPLTVTTRLGTSTFDYDNWGRLKGTTRFDTVTASVVMNAMGYVESAKDVLNRTTNLLRDGIGRVKQVTNARSDIEKYFFDNDGNMTGVENGNGRTRSYNYTDRGELWNIQFADGNTEQYKFDGNGNQTQRINGMQQTIGYTYDSVDNLTLVDYPIGTDTTIGYDNDGRQTVMYDATGGTGWDYDWADNVTKLTTPQGIMEYTYDQWNRQTKLKEGTIETNYGFTNEKLSTITKSTDGVATTLTYDNYGRLHWKNDGATKTEYGYDTNDRVNSIVHSKTSNNQVLHQETYNYDPANNLGSKMVNSVLTSYTYDEIDQLKTENSSTLSNTYNYDYNGNRTSRISNAGTDIYTYDFADKLTGISRSYGAGSTYTYDGCGRTATISGPGGTRMFTWDYEDRLTNLSGGGVPSTNYGYNGVGARTSKSNTLGSRTYKRNGVDVDDEVLSDGVGTFVPGIAERIGGVTRTIHSDALGSTKALSNSGVVTDTVDFDSFGKVTFKTGVTATQKGFNSDYGYQEDGESGYKLVGHRYYDPETGRFLSRDPAFDGRNWYAFCDNNPNRFFDGDGQEALEKLLHPFLKVVQGGSSKATGALVGVFGKILGPIVNLWPDNQTGDEFDNMDMVCNGTAKTCSVHKHHHPCPDPATNSRARQNIKHSKFQNCSIDDLLEMLKTATGDEKKEIQEEIWRRTNRQTDRKSRHNKNTKKPKGTNKKPPKPNEGKGKG
ncbi:MAG: RHS repeat-associated core domain-containing protein [Armatimonadota bacterium]